MLGNLLITHCLCPQPPDPHPSCLHTPASHTWPWVVLGHLSEFLLDVKDQELHPMASGALDVGDSLAGVGVDDARGGHAQAQHLLQLHLAWPRAQLVTHSFAPTFRQEPWMGPCGARD